MTSHPDTTTELASGTDTAPAKRAKLLAVVPPPLPIRDLSTLAATHPGATISSGQGGFWIRTPGHDCRCHRCFGKLSREYRALTGDWLHPTFTMCPACGNKRCPKATDHRQACTGSNEPSQTPASETAMSA